MTLIRLKCLTEHSIHVKNTRYIIPIRINKADKPIKTFAKFFIFPFSP